MILTPINSPSAQRELLNFTQKMSFRVRFLPTLMSEIRIKPRKNNFFHYVLKIGMGKPQQKCAERVFQSRKAAENGGLSLGVQPTVGLGAALLIFLGVGVFAAGIAQAFQMVRIKPF